MEVKKCLDGNGRGFTVVLGIRYQERKGNKSAWDGRNFYAENLGDKTFPLFFQPPKHSVRAFKKYLLYLVSSMGLIDCCKWGDVY